jgi:pimeloyl-ACP methyl ester carboxylesterase
MTDDVERHLVASPFGYVHLRTTGTPAAGRPDLLLLHQIPASSRIWLPVMAELAPLSCIAPDTLNLGESDRTPRPLSLAEHAETLWQAAQSVRPGPKVVIGHHTGATLAALLAASHPEEVVGLGLIGYPLYQDWSAQFARFQRLNPTGTDPEGAGVAEAWRFVRARFADDAEPDIVFDAFADRIRAGRVWYEGYVALFTSDLTAIATAARSESRPTAVLAMEHDILSAVAPQVAALLGVEPTPVAGGVFALTEDPPTVAATVRALYDQVPVN